MKSLVAKVLAHINLIDSTPDAGCHLSLSAREFGRKLARISLSTVGGRGAISWFICSLIAGFLITLVLPMWAQSKVAADNTIRFFPPYSLYDSATSTTSRRYGIDTSTSNFTVDIELFRQGGGRISSAVNPKTGLIKLSTFVLGSPDSEWSKEKEFAPDHKMVTQSSIGVEYTPIEMGPHIVTIEYTVHDEMLAVASYWSTDVVPLSLSQFVQNTGLDYLAKAIPGKWAAALLVLNAELKGFKSPSAANAEIRFILRPVGDIATEYEMHKVAVKNVYPMVPLPVLGNLYQAFVPHQQSKQSIHDTRTDEVGIYINSTDPYQIWIDVNSMSEVWGWAGVVNSTEVTIHSISVSGVDGALDNVTIDDGESIPWRVRLNKLAEAGRERATEQWDSLSTAVSTWVIENGEKAEEWTSTQMENLRENTTRWLRASEQRIENWFEQQGQELISQIEEGLEQGINEAVESLDEVITTNCFGVLMLFGSTLVLAGIHVRRS